MLLGPTGPEDVGGGVGVRVGEVAARLALERWRGCAAGSDVRLWTLAGWGHQWPRAATARDPGVIDATRVALACFDTHRRRHP